MPMRLCRLCLLFLVISTARAATVDRDVDILYRHARTTLDADSAAALYKQVVEMFPRDTLSAWALLRLAQYADARGEQADLEERISRLRELYPHTTARAEAAALLPERREEPDVNRANSSTRIPRSRPTPAPVPAPVTPVVPTPVAQEAVAHKLAVQLGAFGVKANALRMQALAAGTYPAEVVERKRGATTLYIVLAGTFASQSDATKAVDALEKETGTRGVIVTR